MGGLSSRVGATHWNATSKILFSMSSFTASVNIGSSMSLTLPLLYFSKAHLTVILSLAPLLTSIGRRPERISRSKIP
uniref:Uncharacterized protein n=1 Tax=Arundo donax TaxID=35708 RepID=A0A0A9VDB1_ARUDO